MISINNVRKTYDGKTYAVDNLTMSINEHEVFGLVGTNGAGKSTLLRMISGVLVADSGEIMVEGENVYDNPRVKKNLFFIPDDPFYFPAATADDMASYYAGVYPETFSMDRFTYLMENFHLDRSKKIASYSKGMKKQLAIIIGICSGTKYLLCDETFDGLDPVMRQAAKSLFAKDMEDRGLTPILTSHNLRELEDICDHVGLLHQGGVLLDRDLNDMKVNVSKIQCVFKNDEDREALESELDILIKNNQGRVYNYTVNEPRETIEESFKDVDMLLFEVLPLTLEEIFISETEVVGYDIKKIIEG
ncbi:MAG: ABC transporter ATP-binding protein [Lachnospiraceae bacterium]|nr:ABC transporter ATP-binding protein [Lachnospiraceae bacterium]